MTDSGEFLVVGIGASAGGIQAIRQFFARVPPDSGIAYVVILHLSPEHESHLADVLQMTATIPVVQVEDQVLVEPDRVYVIPPNQSLTMNDGHLRLSTMVSFEERRAPVDIFFRTLAESVGRRAVAVVLSGTGANGSMGLKRVKELGGLAIAQDPQDAEFGDMPRHSIASGLVDHVLTVDEIPGRIMGDRPGIVQTPLADQEEVDDGTLRDIFTQLRVRTGHDFSNYKRATVLRRIARRMALHRLRTMSEYSEFVRGHVDETKALLKDLLISVTNFFRDREAFEKLERVVIPRLFAAKGSDDQVRVWIAGCATGEEAYSIAMLLAEHSQAMPGAPDVQLFATDIDEAAIASAREGVYTLNDAADVSPERLRRFFTKEGELYRVRKEVREMLLFAHHNIIKDPPFSHLDLVSCRNLLIYLNRSAQRRVMEVMHFALNPGGHMFLGSSESVEGAGDLFVSVEKDAFLFQSRAVTPRVAIPVPELSPAGMNERRDPDERRAEQRARERLSSADLHQRLLESYAPPSAVVNADHDIVHLSERAGRYLQYSGGEPTNNLLRAIRPELRIELRTALYQAAQQRANVEAPGLALRIDDRTVVVNLVVRPVLKDDDTARGFFLVLFQEEPQGEAGATVDVTLPIASGDATRQLEDEVMRVKNQLRATIERHETQSEELKASNEELQAMNEELRSSAEELETSKEELESVNEELRTVNQELKIKVDEQTQANDDIHNLVNSTEIGTIFLDRLSRIKLFTPHARDIFTLIPADRGRPLSDISSNLVDADLHRDIERVLERLERVEREVATKDGGSYLMRILPYRTSDDRIDGVAVTFVDISARLKAERQLRRTEGRSRLLVESVSDHAIFTLSREGIIDSWNTGAARMFGYEDREAIGQPAGMLFTPEDRARDVPAQELMNAVEHGHAADERWHLRRDGTRFFASGAVSPLREEGGTIFGFVKVARDLTERKQWEDALQQAHADLELRVQRRTSELAAANRALDAELNERRQAESQVRGLMRRLITVQEDERRRIARDLHDHLGQQVAGVSLKVEGLANVSKRNAALRRGVDEARELIAKLDRDLDFFTWELRPATLGEFGLAATLGNFVREWSKEFAIAGEFQARGLERVTFTYEIETNLYRIAQEALNNIYKHAAATHVDVILERRDSELVLVVEDNGRGFERKSDQAPSSQDRGIGLLGMQERAAFIGGSLEIESSPSGTTVFARVPVALKATAL